MDRVSKTKVVVPFAIQWKILEGRLREIKDAPGKFLDSKTFIASNISGIQYYIRIFPNGQDDDDVGKTKIFFHLLFADKIEIQGKFCIKIESANVFNCHTPIYNESKGWGGTCCKTEELFDPEQRFIIDGEMTIKVEGSLMFEKEVVDAKPWEFNSSLNSLGFGLWKNDASKDFTLIADNKEITAHKCVLATVSPVFEKMFESGMKEAKEKKVEIKDFSFEIIEYAVKLCYHHSLVLTTTLEEKMQLLQFFDKYDIQPLKNDLESFLISEISESTFCRLANTSLLSNALKLKKKCAEFLQNCINSKSAVSDFDSLDKDFAFVLLKNSFFKISL
uniref:BTB domain-containing protein n=1 Tax=Panagrolaimus sp. ES5 TaxID=591445 RepID=A0AC34FU71_9BILA